jgi:hypothetical protein
MCIFHRHSLNENNKTNFSVSHIGSLDLWIQRASREKTMIDELYGIPDFCFLCTATVSLVIGSSKISILNIIYTFMYISMRVCIEKLLKIRS